MQHWLAALLLWLAAPAFAHLTPNSEVQLDLGPDAAIADIVIPQGEYGFATGNPTDNTPDALATASRFLTHHVRVQAADGRAWRMAIRSIGFEQIAGPPDLHAIVALSPPPGASTRRLTLGWRAIIDRVPSHFVLFVLRSDFAAGQLSEDRRILGALQGERRTLAIDRGDTGLLRGFMAAVRVGMRHIAEGHDHLLFLLALLLPAPMLAASGRWRTPRNARTTLWHLAAIVTAFSIGHSLTLIGAAAFGWQLPAPLVEALIAVSILSSAIHAWRPLFPGREPAVAAGFGLVHGLAFATVVGHFGLGATEKALSILGFNLGIELVQLAVVAAVTPLLLWLAATRGYPAARSTGAAFAGLAAVAWLAERISGSANPVGRSIDWALGEAIWPIGILLAVMLAWRLFELYRSRFPRDAA